MVEVLQWTKYFVDVPCRLECRMVGLWMDVTSRHRRRRMEYDRHKVPKNMGQERQDILASGWGKRG
jgi:hypothetical protein